MKRKASSGNNNPVKKVKRDYQLHTDGFEIISGPGSSYIINEIKEIGDNGYVIFNNKSGGGDDKRSQTFLNGGTISADMGMWTWAVRSRLTQKYPNLTPMDAVVLKSVKGCRKQLPHCDYEQDLTFATTQDRDIPLGCLICVMEGTTLDVWPKSHRLPCLHSDITDSVEPISRTTIKLNVGEMLVFRGDLVHAGSSYQKDNYRVHVFLDSDKVFRNKNRTWFMDKANYIKL